LNSCFFGLFNALEIETGAEEVQRQQQAATQRMAGQARDKSLCEYKVLFT